MIRKFKAIIPTAVLVTVAALAGRGLDAQDVPAAGLQSQLQVQYKLATTGTDASGVELLEPGTVLVVQKAGLLGVAPTSALLCAANYQDGSLQAPGGLCKTMVSNYSRYLEVGEKVYATKIAVDLKKEKISFTIIECDSCNGATQPSSYKSEVAFQYPKGYLEGAQVSQIEDVVSQVLAVDTGSTPAQQQTAMQPTTPAAASPSSMPGRTVPSGQAGGAAQSQASPHQPDIHVKDTILYRLFDKYPYDTKQPFAVQYPRVALTIVSVPPNHAEREQQEFGGGFIPGDGCFTLQARVWSSAKASQDVGPFQWCSPQDLPKDFQPQNRVLITPCDGCSPQYVSKNEPTGSALAAQRGVRNRLLYTAGVSGALFANYLDHSRALAVGGDTTGTRRTDGPVPPDLCIPTDPAHNRYYASNTGGFDMTTNDGGMVLLMFDAMDLDLNNPSDRRVWIVRFIPATE
jgi:hypothetical protein